MKVLAEVMLVGAALVAVAQCGPRIVTEGGRIEGKVEKSINGRTFHAFYSIPYARPPIGTDRLKDPAPPVKWHRLANATKMPPPCLQVPFLSVMMGMSTKLEDIPGSENCLYLNVFTPVTSPTPDKKLPVMVWLHGGGFFSGAAEEYLPHTYLDYDVVMVVVQYRLGVLGFLSTEDSVMPGNLGLKDQTMALQWVQRNIHSFGGDKTRVTIFGGSAGGASVHYQMLTPKAEGLFSRAILQSGTALCPWALNKKPREVALRVAGSLGCPTDQGSHAILDCLQGVDANDLVPLYKDFRGWSVLPTALTPWVDGHYLPAHPAQLVREGRHAQVDIMAGVTKDEGAFFALPALQRRSLLEKLQSYFSIGGPASLQLNDLSEDPVAVARQVYLHYLGTTHVTEAHAESFSRMLKDRHFAVGHDLTTSHHASHLHPAKKTFRYELHHYAQLSLSQLLCSTCDREWVSHGDDLFYLFYGGPVQTPPAKQPRDLQRRDDLVLRDIITTLWSNFAATGNPTPDDSLGFKWEPSTADNLHYLSLTPSPSMQPDNREEIRKFHNSLPTLQNSVLHPHLIGGKIGEQQPPGHASKTEL